MKLNRPATIANLLEKQKELMGDKTEFSKEEFILYSDINKCLWAIESGYEDSVILEALQFVGPGIAVQS